MKNMDARKSKKDVTPLLMHWGYVFLALTHGQDSVIHTLIIWCMVTDYPVTGRMSTGMENEYKSAGDYTHWGTVKAHIYNNAIHKWKEITDYQYCRSPWL